jgi:hypothetical protein
MIATVADVLDGVVSALVDPILAVLRKEICVGWWRFQQCFTLQDVLEGISAGCWDGPRT